MSVRVSRISIVAVALLLGAGGRAVIVGQTPASDENSGATTVQNPVSATPESITSGQATFEGKCARCHGPSGKGGVTVGSATSADLTDDKWDHGGTDGEVFNTIKNGVAPAYMMEPWEGQLDDTDIWNVVNYIRTLREGESKKSETQ